MSPTHRKPVNIIVACSENRVIGRNGRLPWRIKEDLNYLLETIRGGVVIEGRRVYEELNKAFAGTHTIVLTSDPKREFPDATRAGTWEEALELANRIEGYPIIWIGGGQAIYEQAMRFADQLYLTLVHAEVEGDTFFPEWRETFTEVVSERRSSNGKYDYTFYVLERPADSSAEA